jgi:hypothetical protein
VHRGANPVEWRQRAFGLASLAHALSGLTLDIGVSDSGGGESRFGYDANFSYRIPIGICTSSNQLFKRLAS